MFSEWHYLLTSSETHITFIVLHCFPCLTVITKLILYRPPISSCTISRPLCPSSGKNLHLWAPPFKELRGKNDSSLPFWSFNLCHDRPQFILHLKSSCGPFWQIMGLITSLFLIFTHSSIFHSFLHPFNIPFSFASFTCSLFPLTGLFSKPSLPSHLCFHLPCDTILRS